MHLTPLNLFIAALLVVKSTSAAIILPRAPVPKGGGGGGGGGHAGGGGGGHASSGGGGGHTGSTGGGHSGGSSSSSGGHTGSSGSGAGRGGSGDTGHPPISNFGGTTTSGSGGGSGGGSSTRSANYFSPGGGSRAVTPPGSVFSGREYGGGDRSEVLGTRGYGSGYPYTSSSIQTSGVVGQPFPFGFWPLYWAGHGRSYQYGGNDTVDSQRPGGEQVLVQLLPNITGDWNTTTINGVNETYWMIGDDQSVITLLSILVDPHNTSLYGCSVQNTTATITPFNFNSTNSTTTNSTTTSSDEDDATTPIHFENVIQWYRASSFALAFEGYTNAYALPPLNETAGLGWNDSTPLPPALEYSPFLQCINNTITAALPILDSDSDPSTSSPNSTDTNPSDLTPGQIAGIVIGSIAGAVLLGVAVFFLVRKVIHDREKMGMERNGPNAVIEDKMETSDAVEEKDGSSSVLAPTAYAEDDKPSTSETPLLSALPSQKHHS